MSDKLYTEQLESTKKFIDKVIKSKYLLDKENTYEDMINKRIMPTISNFLNEKFNNNEKSKLSGTQNKLTNLQDKLQEALLVRDIIPGGSISFGLGNTVNCSLSNCYFTPIKEDSLTGIFEASLQLAKIFQNRGGSGIDLSILRPAGCTVNNSARTSSGPVSFMPKIAQDAATVGQNGRRAALMISMSIWHPDIELFIKSKTYPEEVFKDVMNASSTNVNTANISVLVTKDFIDALANDKPYELRFPDIYFSRYHAEWDGDIFKWEAKGYPVKVYKTINPRDIVHLISECAHKSGDPGVLNWHNHTKYSMGYFDNTLVPKGVNPCSEQSLPEYGNCLLSAINLTSCVKNKYVYRGNGNSRATFDLNKLRELVHLNTFFLNCAVELNNHPLPQNTELDTMSRRIGIEFTGLGDVFSMLGMKYGSAESIQLARIIGYIMLDEALQSSISFNNIFSKHLETPIFKCPSIFKDETDAINYVKVCDFYTQPFFTRVYDSLKSVENEIEEMKPFFTNCTLNSNNSYFTILNDLQELFTHYSTVSNVDAFYYFSDKIPLNTSLLTVGPTGTISIVAGNITSGIEPVFALAYKRKSILTDGAFIDIVHAPLLEYLNENNIEYNSIAELKDKFKYLEANDIGVKERLSVQEAMQVSVDTSISSTINLPADANVDTIESIFTYVILSPILKGVTVFRDSSKEGVLSITGKAESKESEDKSEFIFDKQHYIKQRNYCERSYTFCERWKNSKIYITVTVDDEGIPMEVFTNIPKEVAMREVEVDGIQNKIFDENLYREYTHLWNLVCRLVSALLRTGYPLDSLFSQLNKSVYNPFIDLGSIINRVLIHVQKERIADSNIYEEIEKYKNTDTEELENKELIISGDNNVLVTLSKCPKCGKLSYMNVSGCGICTDEDCLYASCS